MLDHKPQVLLVSVIILPVALALCSNQQGNPPTSKKVIKDLAEYNAYMAALNEPDPAKKAVAMESFADQYPKSVVQVDALEQAMAGYQKIGSSIKVEAMAKRILQVDANNVRALAIVTYVQHSRGSNAEARSNALKGLDALRQWQRPDSMSEADFEKLRSQMQKIFSDAAAAGDPEQLAALAGSKDWTPTMVDIRRSAQVTTGGDVQAYAIIAGQREILLCTYDCSTLQPGNYRAEVKKGEIRILSTSMTNGKERKTRFRISGSW